ncbi:MAG TPA: PIN domain-containing protein [Thermoanaerobaculia bacterium]
MRAVFGDTSYWIALLISTDRLHERAKALSDSLGSTKVVTSEMVLTEFLNDFSERGMFLRQTAVSLVGDLRQDEDVVIVPQSSIQFQEALTLYAERSDKSWSLTDCSSFRIMQRDRMTQALTHDRHFVQAGFQALLRD